MRAKFVNEKFKEDSDSIKDMGIGYGKKPLTMSWKILDFIKSKGEKGATLTEIQYYIWTELEGHEPYTFWEPGKPQYTYNKETDKWDKQIWPRKTRGHWNTQLLGGPYYHTGLLHKFCKKDSKTKRWILVRMPKPGEIFYKWVKK